MHLWNWFLLDFFNYFHVFSCKILNASQKQLQPLIVVLNGRAHFKANVKIATRLWKRNTSNLHACENMSSKKNFFTYDKSKNTFSVIPVRQAAIANINVVSPNDAWIGTKDALNAAVAPSQHNRTKKLKNPTTNWKRKLFINIYQANKKKFK